MTLEEFVATRTREESIGERIGSPHMQTGGFLYCGVYYICDPLEDGQYWTILGNQQPSGTLDYCEQRLYEWAKANEGWGDSH